MTVRKRTTQLPNVKPNEFRVDPIGVLFEYLEHVLVTELKNEIQLAPALKCFNQIDNINMIKHLKNLHFAEDRFLLNFIFYKEATR
jgi:hypothetical protein